MIRSVLISLLLAVAAAVEAQAPVVPAKQLAQPPTIDGTLSDEEWKGAASFEGAFDFRTGQHAPDGYRAKFWLANDDKYVYFAARLVDPSPGSIHATEYRTNSGMPGDDSVTLNLDLSGSLSDFSSFQANPRGATNITLAGGRAAKREWTGEFLAKSRITTAGWEVEMRIPWSILPLPSGGRRNVRFDVDWTIPRISRGFVYTFIDSGKGADMPIWEGVLLPKPSVDRSLRMLPYAYGGVDQKTGLIANAGLDLKTSLADQIQLVGTINPDFRNVENAILSLDFSRFARIADETRPFFQEGAGYLDSAIFASQRIQKLDAGLNVYGKLGDKVQFGLLNAIDFGNEDSLVVNGTYAPDPVTNYRITATERSGYGKDNTAYLARLSRDYGAWNVFFRGMGSQDTVIGRGDDQTLQLGYYKAGLYGGLAATRRTANFSPGLGFFPETDFQGFNGELGYNRTAAHGPFRSYGANLSGIDYDRTSGKSYRSDASVSGYAVTRSGLLADFQIDRPTFEGSHDRIDSAELAFPSNDPYRHVSLGYSWGEISSQEYRLLSAQGNYRLFRRLQLSASFQRYHLGDADQEQEIVGGNYDLGNDRSVSGRLVRTGSDTNFYLALRRSGNRGAEYYLILGDPSARTFRTSLILKLVVPFRVG